MKPLRYGHHQTITIGRAYELLGVRAAQQLTLWILRYHLEANGFTRQQAHRLIFWRRRAVTRRLIGS